MRRRRWLTDEADRRAAKRAAIVSTLFAIAFLILYGLALWAVTH